MIKTYVVNGQVVMQENNKMVQQKQQSDQQTRQWAQQYVNQIHQIGQQATQRMNETEDNNARNDQGFDNYLLDQSVVQNNATSGHSTQWNLTANQMVRSNPNKYQIVGAPNYIKGTDY